MKLEQRKDRLGKLNLKKVPLIADIRFASTRLNYYTGIKVNWDQFDHDKGMVTKKGIAFEGKVEVSSKLVNDRILDIQKAVKDLFQLPGLNPAKERILSELDLICKKGNSAPVEASLDSLQFFPAFSRYIECSTLSEARKKHVKSTLNHWTRYEKYRKTKYTFENITAEVLHDFEKYLRTRCLKPQSKNSDKLIISPISKNTIHSIMKITRAFWNDARKKNLTSNYPFSHYDIPAEVYGTPIYLSMEERDKLYNAEITNTRLAKVRDIFLFQCMIGVRVGDLNRLRKSNIENGILSYIPRKTKEGKPVTVTVPLNSKAQMILSRYDLPGDLLLPIITDQRYNDYLKELFSLEAVKLDRMVTRLNPLTREPEQVKLCDIASSHLARRTFIGNLYGKVDTGIISSLSGHVQGSKAFSRYHDVSIELQRQAVSILE